MVFLRICSRISTIAMVSSLALGLCGCVGAKSTAPAAVAGTLDLRSWDFEKKAEVPLNGDWDFFPGVLLDERLALETAREGGRLVPDFWRGNEAGSVKGMGAGTYRLRLLLPENSAGLPMLGLGIPTISTAFELDANGVSVAHAGRPAVNLFGSNSPQLCCAI